MGRPLLSEDGSGRTAVPAMPPAAFMTNPESLPWLFVNDDSSDPQYRDECQFKENTRTEIVSGSGAEGLQVEYGCSWDRDIIMIKCNFRIKMR